MVTSLESVIPVIVCQDIAAEHDFLVNVLGFKSGGVQTDADGNAVHGEIIADTITLWLHAISAEHSMAAPGNGPNHGGFVVFVEDVDTHYADLLGAGITPDSRPTDQEYGQREYGVTDPEGHRWWFATRL